ncbi:MAG TPA: sugar ABC transporter permease [Variovorax sp.]|nr:sugar ABC transporter permease [Variovorax sp.]
MSVKGASYEAQRRRFVRIAMAPSLLFLLVVAGLPTVFLLVTSLTPGALVNPGSLGDFSEPLRNYRLLGSDERFVGSLGVQARLSVYTVVLQVLLGTGLALLVHSGQARWKSLRHLFVIPMVLPPIVVAVIWKLIYTPDISPIYQAARMLGVTLPALTTHVDFALWSIVIADTWEWAPFTFLMVLAALQTLPAEYVEAARMDGADAWRVFGHIVLPYIAPVLLVCTLFRLIDSIKAFPLIFLLTGGGPGSVTEVTNYYAYLVAFNFGELGYSSAITVVLLAATVLISWGAMRVSRNAGGAE